ncbi:hypothetical protein Leryth_003595 [Lithospermum erythrorhizon]|nr:hypothetical protein Leryth_003595 [Lithospermum erythrorhizon]
MQKNPGAKTIEGELEEALYQAGAVPESDRGQSRKYDWARSARTDKGVSAVGQVVSGRFYVDPPGFVERLNSKLPDQIRIFGYKRVTGSFHAKKFCDRRRYMYLLPVFALDSSCHRDRESVVASLGSGNDLVKCLECSERGRKVFGVMGKRAFDDLKNEKEGLDIESGSLSNNTVEKEEIENGVSVNGEELKNEELKHENGDVGNGFGVAEVKKSEFCYGDKERERFNRILKYYEGTHNFHNFTTRTKAEDPSAHRYIISFDADSTVVVDGIEFVKCEVVGQSFMLHQIRKMIGLAVAIMRDCAPEFLIETAFRKDVNINVPMAPEVGLYLDECFFYSYNNKWEDSHEEVSMKAYAEEAEEFKMKYIFSHIASAEHKDGAVALWLHSLNYRNYPDLHWSDCGSSKAENIEVKDLQEGSNDEVNTIKTVEVTNVAEGVDV